MLKHDELEMPYIYACSAVHSFALADEFVQYFH
jgi:hypothetical protein